MILAVEKSSRDEGGAEIKVRVGTFVFDWIGQNNGILTLDEPVTGELFLRMAKDAEVIDIRSAKKVQSG